MPAIPPAPGQGGRGETRARATTNISGTGSSQPRRGGGSTPGQAVGVIPRGQGTVVSPGGFGPGAQSNPIIDAMLGLLNGAGAGGGGAYRAGYNGAAARAAANAAYKQQLGNTKNVYGQIVSAVVDRAPAIAAGYQQATEQVNADAAARAAADQARAAEADQRNAQTAAALGLSSYQPGQDTQADVLQAAGQNAYQANAGAWTGFNNASAQLAGERNTAVADAFRYGGAQTETQLAVLLQQALDSISGREAANPGGYVGGGGGASFNDQFKVLNALLGYDMDQQKLAAASGSSDPLSSITPEGWAAIQQAYGGGVVSGSQGNAAALAGLANNPADFARLYATLYG